MNVLAIVGSPRKGKATDILVDKAIEGIRSLDPDCDIKKIHITDHNIQYCRNCLICRDSKTDGPLAKCSIRDDMDVIQDYVLHSDVLIFGTPVHSGHVTAPMATFLERISWTHAKPTGHFMTIKGLPVPRSDKRRKACIIVVSGVVPPLFKRFCNDATPFIKDVISWSINAKTVVTLYAGNIEQRGVGYYFDQAFTLGKNLIS